MTTEAADYLGKILARECQGWGDQRLALERIARSAGLSVWTLDHIRKGRAKTVSSRVRAALKLAYIRLCEQQILKLQQELAVERAMGVDIDHMADFEREAAELAEKVAKAKAAAQRIHRD